MVIDECDWCTKKSGIYNKLLNIIVILSRSCCLVLGNSALSLFLSTTVLLLLNNITTATLVQGCMQSYCDTSDIYEPEGTQIGVCVLTFTVVVDVCHQSSKKRDRGRNYCYFCDETVINIPRHMQRRHSELLDVSAVLCKRKGTKERNLGFLRLRNLGNFKHNIAVLESGSGTLRVCKRSASKGAVAESYLPCIYCFAFYGRDQLWRHVLKCPFKVDQGNTSDDVDVQSSTGRVSCCAASQLLLDGSLLHESPCFAPEFKASVIDKMHKDRIRSTASGDQLIVNFGTVLFKRLGPQRSLDIQQRMRQLARLLNAVNAADDVTEPFTLKNLLAGRHFDTVIEAVHRVAEMSVDSTGRRVYRKPSLAGKLGHSLKKCAQLKLGLAIRESDHIMEQEATAFLYLHNSDWQDNVSSVCNVSLKLSKMNKVVELPNRDDLDKLKQYQLSRMQQLTMVVTENPQYTYWRELSELALSRLTLFNKRRGGEAALLLVSQYLQRPKWEATCNPEIASSLKPVEKELLKRMDMVQIPGKRLNAVPILLTPDVKAAMDVLVKTRAAVGIPTTNKFFFPSYSKHGHLDPCQVIQRIVKMAGVQYPERITTTKLRKYVATMMQLLDLNHTELDWLSSHLGHTLNIHKAFYRQHTSAIEIGKVTRLLMQVENGQAADYSGKTLDEINVEGIFCSLRVDCHVDSL